MTKIVSYCITAVLLVALSACDVHEFPYPRQETAVALHLCFDGSMPLFTTVNYVASRGQENSPAFERRYIINAYDRQPDGTFLRIPYKTFTFYASESSVLDYDAVVYLPEGEWQFRVWCDVTVKNHNSGYFYNADNFGAITVRGPEDYTGDTDHRDAFVGMAEADNTWTFENGDPLRTIEATVPMSRPLAKYIFIATDYQEFVTRMLRFERERGYRTDPETAEKTINPDDYYVVVKYPGYMPFQFNVFTNKPADSWTGISYRASIRPVNTGEAELAFDYVFVNGSESGVTALVEVYFRDGSLVARSRSVNIPLRRSTLTEVRGNLLSELATGGVGIDPSFDGEFNFKVN